MQSNFKEVGQCPFAQNFTATGKAIYLVFHHFSFSQNVIGWHDHPILAKSAEGLNIICQFNQMEKFKSHPQGIFDTEENKERGFYVTAEFDPTIKGESIW